MNEKKLYIVATPIGNLSDITFRALEILKQAEVVICEDTRQTNKLLSHYQIKKPLKSLHQHSDEVKILNLLNQFSQIAYVSDAGTPGISDPGGKIVAHAISLAFNVIPIPGPSALITALSVSGLPTDKFIFLGFMPHKSKNKIMNQIADSQVTACFYESPHRIIKTLEALKNHLEPDRQVVVARELTKIFESIYRGSLAEVIEQVKAKPKGEFVVIVAGKK